MRFHDLVRVVSRSAEIGGLRPSSGAEIAAFSGSAEYFDLTRLTGALGTAGLKSNCLAIVYAHTIRELICIVAAP